MTSPHNRHIIIVAGEASGDEHAARLVQEIKKIDPQITFSGLGGPMMQSSGVEIYEDLTQHAVVGFIEILKNFGKFRRLFHLVLEKIRQPEVKTVVMVDYPGFNLRLAKKAKKLGKQVIYYISPQLWAWKEDRIHHIKKYTDKMIVFFEFEKNFYLRHQYDADFVGHPLVDNVQVTSSPASFFEKHGLGTKKLTIGLLPGSREKEIRSLLPPMLKAGEIIKQKFPQTQFLLLKSSTVTEQLLEHYITKSTLQPKIVDNDFYNGINACQLCVVASGTATLETALLKKPMVVIYKTSFLTWILARLLIKIPNIGLVNVVAGKRIVPECVQFQANGRDIAREIENIFTNQLKIAHIKKELEAVRQALGPGGASKKAAQIILKNL